MRENDLFNFGVQRQDDLVLQKWVGLRVNGLSVCKENDTPVAYNLPTGETVFEDSSGTVPSN